jgi:hypothetical protein
VSSSIGSPTLSEAVRSENASVNRGWMDSWTRTRFVQMHVCPAFRNFDAATSLAAFSMSASSKTRKGALPPSSRETRLSVCAACE